MLSMADSHGDVKASIVGLAHMAHKSLSETQAALTVLSAPDPNSGRKEEEGRRITDIEGGWHLVTHGFYRELGMSEDTKKYWREKKRKQRMSKTVKDSPSKSRSLASVHASASGSDSGKKEESEGKRKGTQKELEDFAESLGLPRTDGEARFHGWEANGWTAQGKAIKSWKASMRNWKLNGWHASQKPKPFQRGFAKEGPVQRPTKEDLEWEEHKKRQAERKRLREQGENV